MDGHRFDRITKALFVGVSRRKTVGVLAAGLTAIGAAALGWQDATARRLGVEFTGPTPADTDPTCKGKPAINDRACRAAGCTRDHDCGCATTVNGQKRCVNLGTARCPLRDQCDRNKHCARGRVCVRVGGCCGRDRYACLLLCG